MGVVADEAAGTMLEDLAVVADEADRKFLAEPVRQLWRPARR